jgi:hypothetical protein
MPAKGVGPYIAAPSLGRLGRAKAHWKVSLKALIVQAHRLKLITPSQYTGPNVNYSNAGYARGVQFPIPLEKPSTPSQAIKHHLETLRYSVDEIATLLMISPVESDLFIPSNQGCEL